MCIGEIKIGSLEHAQLSAVIFEGLTAKTADGRPARIAIVDDAGNIIEDGTAVAEEVWNVAIASYKNFLIGEGHMRVHTSPPGLKFQNQKAA
ncbi:hypothetical protein NK214_06615 [Chromobacterium sp. S0633]|uniref:hypothetical protein n=1 Tax=Chromobacterium sp. S0633 TaxID=2957805 RepID=UPI00209D2668|nr:hypothetical protein [Chromobacterium sp. S0633]MCP1289862.1 hypothetical protein [Chromobacterium sp. S0633]